MANRCKLLWAIFLSMVFSFHAAYAINLGTLLESDNAKVDSGSIATFTILLWTSDNNSFDVHIVTKSKPKEDWIIFPASPEVRLPPSNPDRNIYLPERGYVTAFADQVYVLVPDNTPTGNYNVTISAVAGDSSPGISVAQERILRLNVDVTGKAIANTTIAQVILPSEKKSSGIQQNATAPVNQTPNVTNTGVGKSLPDAENITVRDSQNSTLNAARAPESAGDIVTGKAISSGSARAAFLALATAIIMYIAWRIYKREPKRYHYTPPPSVVEHAAHPREKLKNLSP